MSASQEVIPAQKAPSLVAKFADRYGVEANKLVHTLKATCFKGDVSNEQLMALLIVADQHGLNPWTKEIHAFDDRRGGIVPVVGVDGWARIVNEHPAFDGMDFEQDDEKCTARIGRTRSWLRSTWPSASAAVRVRGRRTRSGCCDTKP
jgi:phage recombination protein Bet